MISTSPFQDQSWRTSFVVYMIFRNTKKKQNPVEMTRNRGVHQDRAARDFKPCCTVCQPGTREQIGFSFSRLGWSQMFGRRTSRTSRPSLGAQALAVFPSSPRENHSQQMSGKTPGSPRHPSSRHPRPSERKRCLGYPRQKAHEVRSSKTLFLQNSVRGLLILVFREVRGC